MGVVRDVLDDLLAVWRTGGTAGLATVVRTFRSAPRLPGAAMMLAPDGTVSGSVSGGCVEGAVYELAVDVCASGVPVLQRYGVSDDDAFEVGLTCLSTSPSGTPTHGMIIDQASTQRMR